jgi:hypothetical protein
MNTIIKIGLGIAMTIPLFTPIMTGKDAYGFVEEPPTFLSLSNLSPQDLVGHSPLSGEQLAAIQGMAGICLACLDETISDHSSQSPMQPGTSSNDETGVTVYQSNQSFSQGSITQINRSRVTQTSSPSGQQYSVRSVQQTQTLTTQIPNRQQATSLVQQITSSTREFINQNLSQRQNVPQPTQSPIGSAKSLAREITTSITQGISNRAARNEHVNPTMINRQFTHIPNGGFLK